MFKINISFILFYFSLIEWFINVHFTLGMDIELKMYATLCKTVQHSVTFPFEVSTYWFSVMMAWIGSKHAADDIGSQNIRGLSKSV
jgi:hypothetical protein